jgi:hypothetical protein
MILDKVKAVCRVTSTAYNEELTDLIAAAFADLGIPDIKPELLTETNTDPLILRAVLTYCKMNFGYCPEDQYARLKASYDEQKSQLLMSSDYTEWGEADA